MTTHINPYGVAGNPVQKLIDFGTAIGGSGVLEKSLLCLVEIRASQINGCAGCMVWHTHEARADGETEARIYQLDAWRESPLYSARERAAIAWTEALTKLDRRDIERVRA